jgi:hypothetical protein
MKTSALDGVCSGLNPYVGMYTLATMTSWGHPISARTSSSTSSRASTDRDTIKNYLEIGGRAYWNPTIKARRISMVGPSRAASCNSSNKYSSIKGSEASNARTPSNRVVWNLNRNFNTTRLQTIMESIQHLAPQDSPLVALA